MFKASLVHISEVDAYPLVVLGLGHHNRVSQPRGVKCRGSKTDSRMGGRYEEARS